MIKVWTDREPAGALARMGKSGSTFAYTPEAASARAVSITMPHRVQSYDWQTGLLPIFEMNVPEGALRERLARAFAKATGSFDDFDLLSLVGRTQLGRIRYSPMDSDLDETVPFQSVDEILRARRDGGMFDYLLDRFARYSGLSGVQPKVLVRDEGKFWAFKARRSSSLKAATHIVKMWDPKEYPELAANEFYCLHAAKNAGLNVPPFALSDSGDALVIERFDVTEEGYLGLEDFCVLNGFGAARKYSGSYETRLFKRAEEFTAAEDRRGVMAALFRLFVLNCALRNGDAHLKNFALVYDEVDKPARLAPIYDLVTTKAYLPADVMALTLEGSTRWPDRVRLMRLGHIQAELASKAITEIFEETADAMSDAWAGATPYFADCSEPAIGERMKGAWEEGVAQSLGLARRLMPSARAPARKRPMAKSQAAVLDYLGHHGGSTSVTVAALAKALAMPASTISAALRVLVDSGLIIRDQEIISLRKPDL